MKKSATVLAMALVGAIWAGPAQAQEMSLGVKGGLNFSKFGGDDATEGTVEPGNRIGFVLGGFANIGFGPIFSVQPEFLYSQKGAKYESGGEELQLKLTYLDIPLLAVISPALQGATNIKPFLVVGPVASIKLSCSAEFDGDSTDCDEDTEGTDLGLLFGAGAGIPAGRGSLLIDGRYGLGMTSIDPADADVKNRGFSVMVGYSFPLGR